VLELEDLRCGFDHEIAAGELAQRRHAARPCDDLVGVALDSALLDELVHAVRQLGQPALQRGRIGIEEQRLRPALGRELGDARAHRAGAEDADDLRCVSHDRG